MDAELERRIREQLDRDEIWRVMQRYARGLDRLDRELARSCYWDDAIEDHGSYVGKPDDFIAWADSTTLAFESTLHGILNHSCDLQGDDAYCETYYIFTSKAAVAPHLMSTGRYIDHFQKRDGEWRIANRVCIIEAQYELHDYVLSRMMPPAYSEDEPCQASRDRNDVSYHRPPVPRQPKQG
ncbi:MAG: nuclear transport factor 2 family protein [Sphingomonadaceae bacterium]